MKASELMSKLFEVAEISSNTCDTIKSGSPDTELKKVAVTCIANVDTIKNAIEWGADLLITHEPTYYDHMEVRKNDKVTNMKLDLIEKSGITIYRYHDHPHTMNPDMICSGEIKYMGLKGTYDHGKYYASHRFTLDEPMTARELAKLMEEKLGIAHVRICGETDKKSTRLATCFGTPAGVFEELMSDDIEIVMVGEACEWQLGEYARDAAALGLNKTLMIMGHLGSERDGMRLLADNLTEDYKDVFETKYFDCGEVYTYSEIFR